MWERLGLDGRDVRNMSIVALLVTLLMFVLVDGAIVPRVTASIVLGVISAVVFVAVTLVMNTVTPDHW